jgi:carboxymethylenebutenolidase
MREQTGRETRMRRRRLLGGAAGGAGAAFLAAAGGTWLRAPDAWAAKAPPPPPPPGYPPAKVDASGITVRPTDPAISAGPVEFPGLVTAMQGYLAAPAGGETYPAILVLHDVVGLTEHDRDVTRRLAKTGYVALVPDLLSRTGGTAKAGSAAQIAAAMTGIAIPQFLQDANTAVRYLETHPLASKTRLGAMGFGIGGAFAWFLMSNNSDIKAAVPFYGGVPNLELIPHINSAVLAIFGDTDGHDANDLKDLDAAMKKAGMPWNYKIEPKAGRGFFDDSRKTYAADAAKDAWKVALDWYTAHLTG